MVKKRISVAAAKAKGRNLQNEICQRIAKIVCIPWGKDADIEGRPMGQSGVDVCLRGRAKQLFPYSIECKYQEKWSILAWIKQAIANKEEGTDWLLFFRKNHSDTYVTMEANTFFSIYNELLILKGKKEKAELKLRPSKKSVDKSFDKS